MLRTFLNVHPTHKPILSLLILYPRPHPAITILSARPPSQPSSSTLSITPSGTTISSLPQAGGDSAFLCLAGGGGTDLHLAGGDSELDAEVRIAAWTVGGGVEQLPSLCRTVRPLRPHSSTVEAADVAEVCERLQAKLGEAGLLGARWRCLSSLIGL
ncbi:unnamed protein product [Closterium sp. NIES-53]